MSLILDGTNGVSDIDGTAATPAIRGTDTNTGIFFPAADTIAFSEGGTEAMRIDSSGNLGVGTTSPASRLNILGTSTAPSATTLSAATLNVQGSSTLRLLIGTDPSSPFGAWLQTTDGAGAGYPINLNPLGGNVGIGTSSPTVKLAVVDTTGSSLIRAIGNASGTTVTGQLGASGSALVAVGAVSNHPLIFTTNDAERARILTGGSLLVGTSTFASGQTGVLMRGTNSSGTDEVIQSRTAGTSSTINIGFYNDNGRVGTISTSGSSTSYVTSSDYRLKENITPMTGALATVSALKPVTYKWKINGSDGQGFVAHELAEVVPDCVVGKKDGMRMEQYEVSPAIPATLDEEGNELTPAIEAVTGEREVPAYQGIDTSFLVATLTAAIQELKATVDAQATRIAALENPPVES
jgi:hypothetical protein